MWCIQVQVDRGGGRLAARINARRDMANFACDARPKSLHQGSCHNEFTGSGYLTRQGASGRRKSGSGYSKTRTRLFAVVEAF